MGHDLNVKIIFFVLCCGLEHCQAKYESFICLSVATTVGQTELYPSHVLNLATNFNYQRKLIGARAVKISEGQTGREGEGREREGKISPA